MRNLLNSSSPPAVERPQASRRGKRELDFSKLHPDQNLTEEEVCEFLAISRSSLRNKLAVGAPYYDPSFPRPHPLRGQAQKGCAIRYKAGPVIEWNRAQSNG